MDGKGRAIDNILIKRFQLNIKYKKFYLEKSDSGLELFHKVMEYMKFYNTVRPHQRNQWKSTGRPLSFLVSLSWAIPGNYLICE